MDTAHPAVGIGLIAALWASVSLDDREAAKQWADEAVRRAPDLGHGVAAGAAAFGDGVIGWLAGDAERAAERYRASVALLEEFKWWHIESETLVRMTLAELLIAHGDGEAARREITVIVPRLQKVGATWYLGRLREWAAQRGIELAEAETAAAS